MSRDLYLNSLRLSRTGIVTWAIILLAYSLLVAYLYDSVKELKGLQETLESLPETMRQAMGTADLGFDPFAGGVYDVRVYVNTEYLGWVPLMVAVYAVFYCGGIVSREAERRTLDLLLSQPLTRHRLLLSKLATFISIAVVLMLVSWTGTAIGLALIDASIDLGKLALAHLLIVIFLLPVSGYCALASCLYLDPRQSLAVAGGITAAMYLLDILAPLLGGFRWLENLSLFHHLSLLDALYDGSLNWAGLAVHLIVAVVAVGVALAVFERRDLSY